MMTYVTPEVFQDTVSAEETKTPLLLHFLSLGIPKPNIIPYYDFFTVLSLLPISPALRNLQDE